VLIVLRREHVEDVVAEARSLVVGRAMTFAVGSCDEGSWDTIVSSQRDARGAVQHTHMQSSDLATIVLIRRI
jgi:hypothetical protein